MAVARISFGLGGAALAALGVGQAMERFASAMRVPLPKSSISRIGGRTRSATGFRNADGQFMSDPKAGGLIEQYESEQYKRHAAGGRARAACARRAIDGTFIADSDQG